MRHNVAEFLSRMSDQGGSLQGFVSAPLQGEAVELRLWHLVQQASRVNGRFWVVRHENDPVWGQTGQMPSDSSKAEVDAWVQPEIQFFPDHTRISLTLKSLTPSQTIAMQTLELPAMSNETQIHSGWASLWSRLGQAVGHLASITWQSGDLVTIDIGAPQLNVGDEILAGVVHVTREHPRDGEWLGVSQTVQASLRVLEVDEESSLARIEKLKAGGPENLQNLMVWHKDGGTPGRTTGDEGFARSKGEAAPQGFDFVDPSTAPRQPLVLPPVRSAASTAEGPGNVVGDSSEQGPRDGVQTSHGDRLGPDAESRADQGQELAPHDQGYNSDWVSTLMNPELWRRQDLSFFGGQSWGVLDTAPCENTPCLRYTGFPSTLLNLVGARVTYGLSPTMTLGFDGRLARYGQGDVEGYEFGVGGLVTAQLSRFGSHAFGLGVGPELEIGKVETVLLERSLSALTVRLAGFYDAVLPFGVLETSVRLSAFDLFAGLLNVDTRVAGRSLAGMPPELGFFLGVRRAPKGWVQLEIGASWALDPSR